MPTGAVPVNDQLAVSWDIFTVPCQEVVGRVYASSQIDGAEPALVDLLPIAAAGKCPDLVEELLVVRLHLGAAVFSVVLFGGALDPAETNYYIGCAHNPPR